MLNKFKFQEDLHKIASSGESLLPDQNTPHMHSQQYYNGSGEQKMGFQSSLYVSVYKKKVDTFSTKTRAAIRSTCTKVLYITNARKPKLISS